MKVVGDFVDNYELGLPSEIAVLNLFDPETGVPVAIVDATGITEMRTGAVTALGARHLARRDARVLGHVGSRGTAYWNVRLLARVFDLEEVRVHSRRPESREAFAAPARRATSAADGRRPTTGSRACAAPTSWWRPAACARPSRCCAPRGSSPARWWCRTGR